jgi:RHS repeat-associated protein
VQYRYGADGQRALKHVMSSGRVTVYFNKMWQTSNARVDWLQGKHVYVGAERLVTKYNSEGNDNTQAEQTRTYYYHSDHLGSAQVVTNYQGQIHERLEYTPYGELWIDWRSADAPEDGTPYRFTGKELDPETGLYYYGARYLDPKTSRWISGDPALGEYIPVAPVNDEAKKRNQNLPGGGGVFNYVNLHVYHYAGNNPVKYTDPDGRRNVYAFIKIEGFTTTNRGYFINSFTIYYSEDRNAIQIESNRMNSKVDTDQQMVRITSPIKDSNAWTDKIPVELIILTQIIEDDFDVAETDNKVENIVQPLDTSMSLDEFIDYVNEYISTLENRGIETQESENL